MKKIPTEATINRDPAAEISIISESDAVMAREPAISVRNVSVYNKRDQVRK